jgi:hypothetical protein
VLGRSKTYAMAAGVVGVSRLERLRGGGRAMTEAWGIMGLGSEVCREKQMESMKRTKR